MKPTVSIEDLPDPIIEYILSYLSPYRDLKQCMQVSKSWYRFVYDVIRKTQRDFNNAVFHMSVQWYHLEAEPGPTITKSLVMDNLVLFGGWTHTAPYPLHQVWRVFNQIHIYNTTTNRWTQVTTATTCPPMAGHSATVHGDIMVVFGGVQKQICDGPFVSTSDVWTLDLKSYKWQKQVTSTDPPPPRYGHSQILVDRDHLIIMGGCGGPNMLYTDIWLLKMIDGPGGLWEWQRMDIRSKENSAPQIAFHPACKVGNQVVVMSKSHKSRSSPASLPNLLRAPSRTWVPPRLDDEDSINLRNAKRSASEFEPCVNGKRGILKRPDRKTNVKPIQVSSSDEEECSDSSKKTAQNVTNSFPLLSQASCTKSDSSLSNSPSTSGYNRNGITDNCNSSSSSAAASTSSIKPLQVNNANLDAQGNSVSHNTPKDDMRQNSGTNLHTRRNRQRQLEGLDRMEQRLRDLRAGNVGYPNLHKFSRTLKRPMCLYVLDISTVFEGYVTWRAIKNQSPSAPEEIILYSLVLGKGEVIMFGGIQKDLNSSEQEGETVPEIVSNSLHFMTAERFVI
ncbi:f-box only protein 42 [Trichonephila inaurata madagascariensis]|uniref:F-box only protein 42 n=1 Tax=Trichonephila inaurata madagascariensis TaxID=2747483 RepID=A0A8X6WL69_9ARAC|nr:f-box only protein 42 [Trichonephila inaurata madagascariensis]